GGVADLLGQHPVSREAFHGLQKRLWVVAGGQLVMSTLARQKRPGSPPPPAQKRAAVIALAIAVMVVAPPTGASRCFDPQYAVDHAERIFDEWVIGLA